MRFVKASGVIFVILLFLFSSNKHFQRASAVEASQLSTLKITNLAAPGTVIPDDLFFLMQVRADDVLLAEGTPYMVGSEIRTVETAGQILLRVNETAVIENRIHFDAHFYVTELSSALDGYRPEYRGISASENKLVSSIDGIAGTFLPNGETDITVVNANYDFAVQIPIGEFIPEGRENADRSFGVEQVELIGDMIKVVHTLPDATTQSVDSTVITIGYSQETEGIFLYRIRERNCPNENLSMIVEVMVSGGAAQVTDIRISEL